MRNRLTIATSWIIWAATLPLSLCVDAQQPLPNAPSLHLLANSTEAARQDGGQQTPNRSSESAVPADSQSAGASLTLDQAEQLAIRNNPQISVAHLLALAQAQVIREARSSEMPMVRADLTAVDAHSNTRVTAGALNNPTIFDRAAGGLTVSQLLTDFGRTHNLVKSSQSTARAQLETEKATELDIRLAVDQAFYRALTAQALLKVAEQTVAERQATGDQVGALNQAKVRSDLDLSLANVQISQANLMLLNAKDDEQSTMASLNDVLGSEQDQQYTLIDESGGNPPPAPTDAEALLQIAFKQRPDLASINDRYLAALQYGTAQRDLMLPTISALGVGGGTPVRSSQILSPWYGAAGANIDIPVFNGFLLSAETKEARLRAQAAKEQVRELRDDIGRDVRTAVLNAQAAFQRIAVTQGMLDQADLALDLAQARYKIGLSSIVELTKAQLAQTEAQIDNTTARYGYQTSLAEVRYETGQ